MEGLRLRRLRRGEGGEVELARLGLLRREQVLEVLAAAKLRERLLRLLPRQVLRLLRLDHLERDLLADLVERLLARRALLLGLEDVEPGAVLEHFADLAGLQLLGLVLEGLAVRRLAAGDEAEIAAALLRGLVLAARLRHLGEVLAALHL